MPFPQRSVPVLERQAPCGGLTGEPNLSLSKVQLHAGFPDDYRVRPLSYLAMQGQLVTDAQMNAYRETFHLNYSMSILIIKELLINCTLDGLQGTQLWVTKYILQGGVWRYANYGFSHRSSVSFGQERSPKSAPTTCTNRYQP